jgi:hypothetical protein
MADYQVKAVIISMDEDIVRYRKSDSKPCTVFSMVIQDENGVQKTIDAFGNQRQANETTKHSELVVGRAYQFAIKPNAAGYNDGLGKAVRLPDGAITPSQPVAPAPSKDQAPAPAPAVFQAPTPKLDLRTRFDQANMNARTAQMQATARVEIKVSLLITGKLIQKQVAEDGTATEVTVEAVRESTLDEWYRQEISHFWEEHHMLSFDDIFGPLVENSHDSNN